jgi:hypothetical protein
MVMNLRCGASVGEVMRSRRRVILQFVGVAGGAIVLLAAAWVLSRWGVETGPHVCPAASGEGGAASAMQAQPWWERGATGSTQDAGARIDPAPLDLNTASPTQIARSELALLAANIALTNNSDEGFAKLVDDANFIAMRGGSDEERQYVDRLIEVEEFAEAARYLLTLADRPGGTSASDDVLIRRLEAGGRREDAAAFKAAMTQRTLSALQRMEQTGLGAAAPAVYGITFWRANVYVRDASPEWLAMRQSLARVSRAIPTDSRALQASYIRSLGPWAENQIEWLGKLQGTTR